MIPLEICKEYLDYIVSKLQQGQETDALSVCNLKIFYSVKKQIPVQAILEILKDLCKLINLVYTLVPVTDLCTEHTYLSVCGVRIQ